MTPPSGGRTAGMLRPGLVAAVAALVLAGDVAALVVLDGEGAGPPPAAAPSGTTTAAPADESLDEQLERVLGIVERVRGLAFATTPRVRYATRDQLRDEVVAQLAEYGDDEADLDQRLLVALAQLDEGADLRQLLASAYGDQVAGYYDPDTAELVVGTDDPSRRVGRLDEITLAHELGHALVDATIGLPDLDALVERDVDTALAVQALVEGDASALMTAYAEVAMSPADAFLLAQEALELGERLAAATQLPPSLQRGLEFPYLEGQRLVEQLLADGGWEAVDAAYADPPTTTLEVLDPSRLGAVEVREPAPFGTLEATWGPADRTLAFGAFDLLVLLELPGNDVRAAVPGARELALAWEGGAVRQWSHGQQTAVAVHLAHDPDAGLCEALGAWAVGANPTAAVAEAPDGLDLALDGSRRDVVVACDDDGVRVGIGPDLEVARDAVGA